MNDVSSLTLKAMFKRKNQILLWLLLAGFYASAQCPVGVNTITVTSNSPNNAIGTFARACQCVNQTGSTIKTILFNISGSTVILPNAGNPLTISANDVLVDATTQVGVILDGASPAGPSPQGIIVTGDGNTIQGLTIRNFQATAGGNGIWLGPTSSGTLITGNTLRNNRNGVFMSDGGVSTAEITENSIFCNNEEGIDRGPTPALTSIFANTQRVRGVTTANSVIEVFFDDKTGCAGAPCQGKTLIGSVTADAAGAWILMPPAGTLQPGNALVATRTINGNNTSEFTPCATVVDCSALDANIAATDITCFGNNNGTATATATGFTPSAGPTFLWSTGATTAAVSSLMPGTFTVTVTDAVNGCTATETTVIDEPVMLNASFTPQNIGCFNGSNGMLTAVPSGGTSPFTFMWSTGGTMNTIGGLTAGIYSVTVTDANNCSVIRNTQLTQPTLLTVGTNATPESVANAGDGTATAIASGGTPAYTYFWSNNATSSAIGSLDPGVYTVTVTDVNGCSRTATATVAAGPGGGPCTAKPVYAVLGPSQVCGNSTLSLEVDDLYPNPAVEYWWYFPNGDSAVTLLPTLDLLVTSTDFSGEYFVVRDSAGCRSIPVGGTPVTVLSLDPAQVFAGTDSLLCAAGLVVLRAEAPPQGVGSWVSLGSATIDAPSALVTVGRNLQTGPNAFVWQVNLGSCTGAAADTVVYFLEKKGLLNDDRYTLQYAQDIAVMEILLNDALAGLPDTVVTQLGAPAVGTLEYLEDGKRFRYMVDEDFRGTVQFQYIVCSPASTCNLPCDTATVTIDIQNLPSVPEGLVVEDPGANGRLTIKGINGFTRVEMTIFNRWGNLVFQENNYRNDAPWLGDFNGKALPEGAYYYYLKAWDGNTLIGGTRTGVIHLFSQK